MGKSLTGRLSREARGWSNQDFSLEECTQCTESYLKIKSHVCSSSLEILITLTLGSPSFPRWNRKGDI